MYQIYKEAVRADGFRSIIQEADKKCTVVDRYGTTRMISTNHRTRNNNRRYGKSSLLLRFKKRSTIKHRNSCIKKQNSARSHKEGRESEIDARKSLCYYNSY